FRAIKRDSFVGEEVGFAFFKATVEGLVGGGWVRRHGGIRFIRTELHPSEGKAARYWPSERLLRMAEEHELTPVTLETGYAHSFPRKPPKILDPVLMRPAKVRGERAMPAVAPDYRSFIALRIRDEVLVHNDFASG